MNRLFLAIMVVMLALSGCAQYQTSVTVYVEGSMERTLRETNSPGAVSARVEYRLDSVRPEPRYVR